MVRLGPPEVTLDGIVYSWNYGKRAYETDPYLTAVRSGRKVDRNYAKAILGVATLQEEAIKGVIQGVEGKSFDNLFRATSDMSDAEIALGIGFLLAFSAAAPLGKGLAKRKSPSLKEIKSSSKFKEIFPDNDVNLDAAILTQKYIYDSSSRETQLKMRIQSAAYREANLRRQQRATTDKEELNRLQKEINENPANEDKLELRRLEIKKKREKLERDASNLDREREEIIKDLQRDSGNEFSDEDWADLYRMRFQQNPSGRELFDFKKAELEKAIESGESPESVIDAWYSRYGTNEAGIDRDLQELGRNVMAFLDPNGTGEIQDFRPMDLYRQYSGQEREAVLDAFNNGDIWNSWKADYRSYVAGGGLAAGAGAAAIGESGGDGEEIKLEEEVEEMDLVEGVRDEEFIKQGEVEITPEGEQKELGKDRGLPSGEPAPVMSPDERDQINPPVMSPDERDQINPPIMTPDELEDTAEDVVEEAQDVFDEGESFREDVTYKNIDELLRLSFQSASNVYEDQVIDILGEYYRVDGYSVPVLFNKQGNKLFVSFRGTNSIANIITDLYTTNPFTVGENKLNYYSFFRNRINEEIPVSFHAGFIEALVYPPSKHKRLGQKIEADYTPLYAMVRENIDNFKGEVTDIVFCGHSLGGSLASICYYLYMNDTYSPDEKILNSVRCVSYGSPRFVLDGSQDQYNKICPNLIRIWNERDIVSYIPFYRGVSGTNILDGFRHVGKSFCLDKPLARNDINRLLVDYMNDGEKIVDRALRGTSSPVEDVELLKKTDYQRDLMVGLFDSLAKCEVKEAVTEEDILNMESKVNKELGEGNLDILQGLGLDKFIEEETVVGEDPRQFYFSSLYGFVTTMSKSSTEAHRLKAYKEGIDRVISIEIKSQVDVLEAGISIEEAEIDEVKKVITEQILEQEVKQRISKNTVLGFVPDYDGDGIIKMKRT